MKPSDRLIRWLRHLGHEIPDGSVIRRTYAGRVQREAGAWSWTLLGPDAKELIGGYVPVTTLLKAHHLRVTRSASGYLEVDAG